VTLVSGVVKEYAVGSINKGVRVSRARADQGIWWCSKSCCVLLPLHQQLQLLSNCGRSNYHSKGQRSMSSGKVIDIITLYLHSNNLHHSSHLDICIISFSVQRHLASPCCLSVRQWRDPEIRSSGKVHNATSYLSARPDIRIIIRHCCLSAHKHFTHSKMSICILNILWIMCLICWRLEFISIL
jgi:hypothetical protein